MLPSPKLFAAARVRAGLTQSEMAAKSKVSKAAVNRIEAEGTSPRSATVIAVLNVLRKHGIRFLDEDDTIREGLYVIKPGPMLPPDSGPERE